MDWEDMILQRQELLEIWEDDPEALGDCWWDHLSNEEKELFQS